MMQCLADAILPTFFSILLLLGAIRSILSHVYRERVWIRYLVESSVHWKLTRVHAQHHARRLYTLLRIYAGCIRQLYIFDESNVVSYATIGGDWRNRPSSPHVAPINSDKLEMCDEWRHLGKTFPNVPTPTHGR